MILEGWECKGCGRPVFYNWPTHAGDSRDDYYFHVVCFFIEGRKHEAPVEPRTPKQHQLWETATS